MSDLLKTYASHRDQLYSAVLADVLDGLGHRSSALPPEIRPLKNDWRVFGRAVTLCAVPVAAGRAAPGTSAVASTDTRTSGIRSLRTRRPSSLDVDTLLDVLVQEAIRLVDAESGVAGLRAPEGMVCRRYFQHGVPRPLEYCWPPMHGLPGWVLEHKAPYLTNDATADPHPLLACARPIGELIEVHRISPSFSMTRSR